jgi:hypothetical protein
LVQVGVFGFSGSGGDEFPKWDLEERSDLGEFAKREVDVPSHAA